MPLAARSKKGSEIPRWPLIEDFAFGERRGSERKSIDSWGSENQRRKRSRRPCRKKYPAGVISINQFFFSFNTCAVERKLHDAISTILMSLFQFARRALRDAIRSGMRVHRECESSCANNYRAAHNARALSGGLINSFYSPDIGSLYVPKSWRTRRNSAVWSMRVKTIRTRTIAWRHSEMIKTRAAIVSWDVNRNFPILPPTNSAIRIQDSWLLINGNGKPALSLFRLLHVH
jgi:hypothetical protein